MAEAFNLTAYLSKFASTKSFRDLSDKTILAARHGLLDWFGVTLAGYNEPLSAILRDTYAHGGKTSIIGGSLTAAPHDAALINGATSHALDYDDCNIMGHSTVAVLPAVLALVDDEKHTPQQILLSYVIGVEVCNILAQQLMPDHYERGFHSTVTLGTIGAAAGVGCLLKLSTEEMTHAIGLAATQAAGLKSMFGTMAKPFHAGKAAANGVMAVQLASRGFTANTEALEIEQGFFSTLSGVTPDAPRNYHFGKYMERNLYKFHASCFQTHPSMNAVQRMMREENLTKDDIGEIDTHIPKTGLGMCCLPEPQTGLEIKFSLAHCLAMILDGRDTSSIASFSDANAKDAALKRLRSKVKIHGDLEGGLVADVTLHLKSGKTLMRSENAMIPIADMTRQEAMLKEKFMSLTASILGDDTALQAAEALLEFDNIPSLETMLKRFTPANSMAA